MSRVARGAATALAAIGVALLVSQPICAAAEPFAGSRPPVSLSDGANSPVDEHCCASLEAPPVLGNAGAPSGAAERLAVVPHPAHVARTQGTPYFFEPGPVAASLPPLRYYARSARILR